MDLKAAIYDAHVARNAALTTLHVERARQRIGMTGSEEALSSALSKYISCENRLRSLLGKDLIDDSS